MFYLVAAGAGELVSWADFACVGDGDSLFVVVFDDDNPEPEIFRRRNGKVLSLVTFSDPWAASKWADRTRAAVAYVALNGSPAGFPKAELL